MSTTPSFDRSKRRTPSSAWTRMSQAERRRSCCRRSWRCSRVGGTWTHRRGPWPPHRTGRHMAQTATTSASPTERASSKRCTSWCRKGSRGDSPPWTRSLNSLAWRGGEFLGQLPRQVLHHRECGCPAQDRNSFEQVANKTRSPRRRRGCRWDHSFRRSGFANRGLLVVVGEALRLADGGIQPAQLVYQPSLEGLPAGPNAAGGDRMNLLRSHLSRLGDEFQELGVDVIDLGLHDRPFLVAVCLFIAVDGRALAKRDRLPVEHQLRKHSPRDDLSGKDSDRSSQRARSSDDPATRRRDPVAA